LAQPPKLDYFKMNEAATLRPDGQFARSRGWDEQKRDDRLVILMRIIQRRVKLRASVSIRHEHFQKYIRSLPAIGRRLGTDSPYPLLLSQLVSAELVHSHQHGSLENHDFILDEQTGVEAEIEELWPQYKQHVERSNRPELAGLLGSRPYFRDDKMFLPLQAADLYAWQVRHHLMSNRVLHVPKGRILRLFDTIPSFHNDMDEARCQRDRARLLARGVEIKKANPALALVSFPATSREQKKARRSYAASRGKSPSPRKSHS
jgi:hypothetical protein